MLKSGEPIAMYHHDTNFGGGGGSSSGGQDFVKNLNDLKEALKNGTVSSKLDKKNQAKHKYGSEEYNKRVDNNELPSYTKLRNMEVQKIINQYSCTGQVFNNKGRFHEVIVLDEQLGMYGNRKTGKYEPTNVFTIHYSKEGSHLVPARMKGNYT